MHGIRRLLLFCTMITILPSMLIFIPLYLRHIVYKDVAYAVTESDIMEINDGISTIFCSEHTLQMNSTFNAFQMTHRPEITTKRKHIRLKKNMNLPDDTLEYWGFYLLKSASVSLTVCSRFQGASILVVKGERNLRTCGLLGHNFNKELLQENIFLPGANRQVIIYESNAQEINSKESTVTELLNIRNTDNAHELSDNESSKSLETISNNQNNTDNNNNNFKVNTASSYERKLENLFYSATLYVQNHTGNLQKSSNNTRKLRHIGSRKIKKDKKRKQGNKYTQGYERKMHVQKLKREFASHVATEKDEFEQQRRTKNKTYNKRFKRSRELIKSPSLLDYRGIKHGGNTDKNFTSHSNEVSSVSSFETSLFNCYGKAILLTHEFEPSNLCTNIHYLLNGRHTQVNHNVEEDGYYYYIFYSDNDIVSNDIYAIFDMYRPTFQYENATKKCVNQTKCSFSLSPLSGNRVIVEIPTKDGIENDGTDDISMLISVCRPRMAVYMIFPIAILLIILGCASI